MVTVDAGRVRLSWDREAGGDHVGVAAELVGPEVVVKLPAREAPEREPPPRRPSVGKRLRRELPFTLDVDAVLVHGGALLVINPIEGGGTIQVEDLEVTIENLASKREHSGGLPTLVTARGRVGQRGELLVFLTVNPWSTSLDFSGRAQLTGLAAREVAGLSAAVADLRTSRGIINLFVEFRVHNDRITGGVRPVLVDVELAPADPGLWNELKAALADVAVEIAAEPRGPHDVLTAVVPLSGRVLDSRTELWEAVLGVLRNAFIEAFRAGFTEMPPGDLVLEEVAVTTPALRLYMEQGALSLQRATRRLAPEREPSVDRVIIRRLRATNGSVEYWAGPPPDSELQAAAEPVVAIGSLNATAELTAKLGAQALVQLTAGGRAELPLHAPFTLDAQVASNRERTWSSLRVGLADSVARLLVVAPAGGEVVSLLRELRVTPVLVEALVPGAALQATLALAGTIQRSDGVLQLDLSGELGRAAVRLAGGVDPRRLEARDLRLELHRLDLAELLPTAPHSSIDLQLVAQGGGRRLAQLDGELWLRVTGATVAGVEVGPAEAHAVVKSGGTLQAPSLAVQGRIAALRHREYAMRSLRLTAHVPDLTRPLRGRVELQGDHVRAGGVRLGDVRLMAATRGERLRVRLTTRGELPLVLRAEGDLLEGGRMLQLDRLLLAYPRQRWRLRGTALVSLPPGGLALSRLHLVSGGQELRLDVRLAPGELSGRLAASDLRTTSAPRILLPAGAPVFLVLGADLRLSGSPERPLLRGDITLQRGRIRGVPFTGPVRARIALAGSPAAPELQLEAHAPSLRIDRRRVGRARLQLTYDGQAGAAELRLASAFGGSLTVSAEARVGSPATSAALGRLEAAPFSARLRARAFDLRALARLVPGVQATAGVLEADVTASGTLSSPLLGGRVAVEGGALRIAELGELSDVQVLAFARRGGVELFASAKSGDGMATVTARAAPARPEQVPAEPQIELPPGERPPPSLRPSLEAVRLAELLGEPVRVAARVDLTRFPIPAGRGSTPVSTEAVLRGLVSPEAARVEIALEELRAGEIVP